MNKTNAGFVGIGPLVLDPTNMMANQSNVIDLVLSRIDATCRAFSRGTDIDAGKFLPNHVITIAGARGAGKTSVLMTTVDRARTSHRKALILDPLRPDLIHPEYPLFPVLLNQIRSSFVRYAPGVWEKYSEDEHHRPLGVSWALRVPKTLDVLSRETLSASEWSMRLSEMLSTPQDEIANFELRIELLLRAAKKEVLVVPIDDADLSIEKAEEIIDLVRTFLASPRIVTVFAADLPSLERRIRNRRLASLPRVPELKDNSSFLFGMTSNEFTVSEAQSEQDYVENLLFKVLPPAARCYLAGLSENERLKKPIRIPGRSPDRSFLDVLGEADLALDCSPCEGLGVLLAAHPEILSSNPRRYINQFLMVSDSISTFLSSVRKASQETLSRELESLSSRTDGTSFEDEDFSNLNLAKISTTHDLLVNRLHLQILRSLFSQAELLPLRNDARDVGIQTDDFTTMSEFVAFVLRRGSIRGTADMRLRYRIASSPIDSEAHSGLMDLTLDWAAARGARFQKIMEQLNLRNGESFVPIPVPLALARAVSWQCVADFEPNLVMAKAAEEGIGGKVIVPTDSDRLAPVQIESSGALGRYASVVINQSSRDNQRKAAEAMILGTKDRKAGDIAHRELEPAFYRLLGIVAAQTARHLKSLELEYLLGGDSAPRGALGSIDVSTTQEFPWYVLDVVHVVRTLTSLQSPQIPLRDRLLCLSYIADLPMMVLLSCCSEFATPKVRNLFLERAHATLDDAVKVTFLMVSAKGEFRVAHPMPKRGRDFLQTLNRHYPELDWSRRLSAISRFLQRASALQVEQSWQGSANPPKLWMDLARRAFGAAPKGRPSPVKAP